MWSAFIAAAAATWVAGVYLARATDALDVRWQLGETLGGMLLLAIAGTLPELAITLTAAASGHLDLAAGNLLGGIAVQTAVLAICDAFAVEDRPLSYLVGSLLPVLEALLVVALVSLAALGTLLPTSTHAFGVSPASAAIVVTWGAGMAVLAHVRRSPKWRAVMPGSSPGRPHRRIPHPARQHPYSRMATWKVLLIFAAGSAVTLAAGSTLVASGTTLSSRLGLTGVVFGATVLALATSLPEISTGVESVRLGDNQLAMADVFGGNAFQLTLFAAADLVAGAPLLPHAGAANSWLACLGIAVTAIYAAAVIIRPQRTWLRLGADSLLVLATLIVGVAGLALVAH
ncbi:MAG: sodium:calcium antiporter [Coriobacteriia bacterium]|nr:sodium:calcium antiporter [Coriobacteriia bacterium]